MYSQLLLFFSNLDGDEGLFKMKSVQDHAMVPPAVSGIGLDKREKESLGLAAHCLELLLSLPLHTAGEH